MMKSIVVVVCLGLAGLFGYYYLQDSSGRAVGDKAADAMRSVGDKVRDEGVAGMVKVRLASKFGLDATRFVHVHFDEGEVLVYGLTPAAITADQLQGEAQQVPGVTSVQVLISTRPAEFDAAAPAPGAPPAREPGKR
jgi:osmotically-inducible protein OsmY